MKLYHLQDIGPHYARTLKDWRERFLARLDDIRELGYSDEFIRLWEYYFCYCEGGFAEREISVPAADGVDEAGKPTGSSNSLARISHRWAKRPQCMNKIMLASKHANVFKDLNTMLWADRVDHK